MVEVMKIMATSFKRPHTGTATLSAPTCSRPPPTHASARDSWPLTGKSGSVSCGVTAPFSWVLVHTRFCLCPLRVCFLVLWKFWQLYIEVNGDLLQEGLCHTQVCWPRDRTPAAGHCSPILPQETQSWLSLCGVSGSWCAQGMLEPSECLWRVWCLILNSILPLLPSCLGFSALGLGVSPQSRSSAAQPWLQCHLLAGEWRDGAKAKTTPSCNVTGDGSKVWGCKEQYA